MLPVLLALPVGAEPSSTDHLSAQEAVSFLELMDQAHYDDAWLSLSPLFQSLNNQAQWQNRQQTIRAAYGALSSRQLDRISYRQTYTLSPDGAYVVVQFESSYTNKANTIETVVLDCRTTPECHVREHIIR